MTKYEVVEGGGGGGFSVVTGGEYTVVVTRVDPNTLYLESDPEFLPHFLDPDHKVILSSWKKFKKIPIIL